MSYIKSVHIYTGKFVIKIIHTRSKIPVT